jgi:hypothetical protein
MKRLVVLAVAALAILGMQFLSNCASPLEPTSEPDPIPPRPPDTIYDTMTFVVDHFDTVFDTTYQGDTVEYWDTVSIFDTTLLTDTLTVTDTLMDTIPVYDTTYINDTVPVFDTTYITDTVPDYDTTYITDTVEVTDTLYDTVTVVDTIYADTVCPILECTELNSCQMSVVWMLPNTAGNYRLLFTSQHGYWNPSKPLIIDIDGTEYVWDPLTDPELIIDRWLDEDAVITVSQTPYKDPMIFPIDICVLVTPEPLE